MRHTCRAEVKLRAYKKLLVIYCMDLVFKFKMFDYQY